MKVWPEVVKTIEKELNAKGKGLWDRLELEIQDGYKSLLVNVYISDDVDEKLYKKIKELMNETVDPKVPKLKDDYPWVCVIRNEIEVLGSVLPELENP